LNRDYFSFLKEPIIDYILILLDKILEEKNRFIVYIIPFPSIPMIVDSGFRNTYITDLGSLKRNILYQKKLSFPLKEISKLEKLKY
jgi:hypothetical protein